MQRINFKIDADPIPAARPRFGNGRTYQPSRNREFRDEVQRAAVVAMHGHEPMTGEICASLKLYRRFKPTARNFGDADNHAKAILDGLNGICYRDDAQIVKLTVEKRTDKTSPRAEIELTCAAVES
ncbi:MAG: RusA family crossover junction endodeoxyribonuclease [Selenomonadaceae bacterium]|nr:RusA family crossover junction endodeoxyribonuclease [Selenomonadaceae bacterium]